MCTVGRSFVCLFVLGALTCETARAQFTSLRRELDVFASAPYTGFPTVTDDPPPVVRDPDFFGSFSTSANAVNSPGGGLPDNRGSATASSSWNDGVLSLQGIASVSSRPPNFGPPASANGSGSSRFQVHAPTTFDALITFNPTFNFSMTTRLRDSSNNVVWQRQTLQTDQQFTFDLAPGMYSVDISFFAGVTTGIGGGGNSSFSMRVVPEPAAIGAVLGMMTAIGTRRPRGRPVSRRVRVIAAISRTPLETPQTPAGVILRRPGS